MAAPVISAEDQGPVAGEIAGMLDRLRGLASEIAEAATNAVDTDDLAVAVVDSGSVSAAVDAALTAVIEAADRKAVGPLNGSRKIEHYVLARSNESGFDVRGRLRRARWLRDFPVFAQAHAAGALTVEHVERIRKGLDNRRTNFFLRRDQHSLVEAAATCDFVDFGHACDYWKLAADPDGAEPLEQIAKTTFTAMRVPGGMVKIDGLLEPLAGQVLLNAWNKELEKLAIVDEDSGIRRTQGQRGAVALLELVTRGSARADGSHPDPLMHIVQSQLVAEDTVRRLAEHDTSPLPIAFGDIDGRCELIDGTPIHPQLALAVMTIAALQRTVMDAKDRPLSTTYPSRNFPKWLKHILMLRSRGRCETEAVTHRFPGSKPTTTSLTAGAALPNTSTRTCTADPTTSPRVIASPRAGGST